MADNKKMLFALSLARKAGKIVIGSEMTLEAIRKNKKVFLVILSSDASENTKKTITDKSGYYGKKLINADADGFELAKAVGKEGFVAVLAVTDENFAKLIIESQ